MVTVHKKGSVSQPTKAVEAEPLAAEVVEASPDTAQDSVEVEHDERSGTAKFSLVNGVIITLKEPKAKDFIYLASRMETAPNWQRSPTMAVYLLSHFMIEKVSIPGVAGASPIPDFDEFMDMLQDDDLERVGAAFACFPNVLKRVERIFANPDSPKP